MTVPIPELSLVVLVGVSGSGKSSFAARHFLPTEVLSSDFCRGLVTDDENDPAATPAAFDVLHYVAAKRLEVGKLTVVDATNVQPEARKPLVALAKKHHVLAVAIVLDVPESVCVERNAARPDRSFGSHVLRNQRSQLRRSMNNLRREGFHRVVVLHGVEEIDAATLERQPLWIDRRGDHGPFDIMGDVHGCFDELTALLGDLGYEVAQNGAGAHHPGGRRAFFVGDLVDRGPATPAVLRLVMAMVDAGDALCIPGNHEAKLLRALRGRNVTVSHGLAETLAQLAEEPAELSTQVEVHRRPRQPPGARRREAGRRPCRTAGRHAGSSLGRGAILRPLRGHHRRDGRVRPVQRWCSPRRSTDFSNRCSRGCLTSRHPSSTARPRTEATLRGSAWSGRGRRPLPRSVSEGVSAGVSRSELKFAVRYTFRNQALTCDKHLYHKAF